MIPLKLRVDFSVSQLFSPHNRFPAVVWFFLAMKAPDGDDMGRMLACKAISVSAGPDGMRKETGRPDSEYPSGDCVSAEGAEQSAFMTLRSVRARRHEEGGRPPCWRQTNENGG